MANKRNSKANHDFSFGALAAFALIFAAIGGFIILRTHAATPAFTSFINSTSAVVTPGTGDITSIASAASTVDYIGQQNVSILAPGAKLTYQQGVKGPLKSVCYYINVVPTKASGITATVQVASPTNYSSYNIDYSATTPNAYQQVCVGNGNKANPGFNVANLSPATGPNIMVYQEALSW